MLTNLLKNFFIKHEEKKEELLPAELKNLAKILHTYHRNYVAMENENKYLKAELKRVNHEIKRMRMWDADKTRRANSGFKFTDLTNC